jgi:hypothetical protein
MPRKAKTSTPIQSRAKSTAPAEIGRETYSIAEFCRLVGISTGTYRNLRAKGLGPAEMRPSGAAHGKVRISAAAKAQFIADCEQRKVPEAEQLADRAKRAGKRAG